MTASSSLAGKVAIVTGGYVIEGHVPPSAEQVAARRQRFVVIEAIAPADIREAATDAAQRSGYVPVLANKHRTILERAAPPAASMPRSTRSRMVASAAASKA